MFKIIDVLNWLKIQQIIFDSAVNLGENGFGQTLVKAKPLLNEAYQRICSLNDN
jgi:hypothetical protein